jgi:hypothetical protein
MKKTWKTQYPSYFIVHPLPCSLLFIVNRFFMWLICTTCCVDGYLWFDINAFEASVHKLLLFCISIFNFFFFYFLLSFYVSRMCILPYSQIYSRIRTFWMILEVFFCELIKKFKMKVDSVGHPTDEVCYVDPGVYRFLRFWLRWK